MMVLSAVSAAKRTVLAPLLLPPPLPPFTLRPTRPELNSILAHSCARTNSCLPDNWGPCPRWPPALASGALGNRVLSANHSILDVIQRVWALERAERDQWTSWLAIVFRQLQLHLRAWPLRCSRVKSLPAGWWPVGAKRGLLQSCQVPTNTQVHPPNVNGTREWPKSWATKCKGARERAVRRIASNIGVWGVDPPPLSFSDVLYGRCEGLVSLSLHIFQFKFPYFSINWLFGRPAGVHWQPPVGVGGPSLELDSKLASTNKSCISNRCGRDHLARHWSFDHWKLLASCIQTRWEERPTLEGSPSRRGERERESPRQDRPARSPLSWSWRDSYQEGRSI